MRLLVVTRRDLPPEAQASQSCQALMKFSCAHPELGRLWFERANHLLVHVAPSENALRALFVKVQGKNFRAVGFHEPQLRMQLTTLVVEATPAAKRIVGKLPIAG